MENNLFNLTGKVAVVTGGTGALGTAMCKGLAAAGAVVVVLARDENRIAEVVKAIQDCGGKALGVSADVLDKAALEIAAQQVIDNYGHIDILVNGAGGNRPEATTMKGQRTFFDLSPESMEGMFDLNFTSAVLASQAFGKHMLNQSGGIIINISSMAAMKVLSRVVAYSAAKAAIDNFTRWLSVYMAREHNPNLRVNSIAPGFFLGEQNRFLLIDKDTGELTQRGTQVIEHTPMGRFGEPDDLIGTLIWLASDASRFVTGIVVPVDGGFSAFSGV